MKIAIIAPGKLPIPSVLDGAIETLATNLIEENDVYSKLDISVFSNYNRKALTESDKYRKTKFHFIKRESWYAYLFDLFFRIIRRLTHSKDLPYNYFLYKCCKTINREIFDFVVVEGGVYHILTMRKKTKSKLILHLHTDILNTNIERASEICKSCYRIITVSSYIKQRVTEISETEPGKVLVLKNGIDITRFNVDLHEDSRIELRRRYGILEKEKVILFCGRLDKGKGVEELLLACEGATSKYRLLIVGATWFHSENVTEYEKNLRIIAERLGNKVLFLGYIKNKEMPKYYAMADIAACPSICNEAAGLVLIEAMASSLPVIASRCGGIPEYADTSTCELVEYDDCFVENLSRKIDLLVDDEEYYRAKRNNCRTVVSGFCKGAYYLNFVSLLKSVL